MKKFHKIALIAVLALTLAGCGNSANDQLTTLEDLQGKKLAMCSGNGSYIHDIEQELPGITVDYYQNYMDTFISVHDGKDDFSFVFLGVLPGIQQNVDGLTAIESNIEIPIVMGFSASDSQLKKDFDKYVDEATADGSIDALAAEWLEGYGSGDKTGFDFTTLPDTNGTFSMALASTNVPAEYLIDGQVAGFEPAVVYDSCQKYGYRAKYIEATYDAVMMGLTTGKYDMGLGYYGYTDERSEGMVFSKPYYTDHVGYVVLDKTSTGSEGMLSSVSNSFYKNFLKENRWRLLASGFLITLLITFASAVLGTGVGFVLFLISYRRKVITRVFNIINDTFESLPALVILMIFFYVIFGSTQIPGSVVSILVFGMMFSFTIFAMISNCVAGVPEGNREAALALGYTSKQALFRVILPQIRQGFVPAYKSAVIALLKGTAIVGYVAVQDLTKGGDLIRSFTFDAFFPLIAVAIVYYILARLLIFALDRIIELTKPDGGARFLKEVVDHANTDN